VLGHQVQALVLLVMALLLPALVLVGSQMLVLLPPALLKQVPPAVLLLPVAVLQQAAAWAVPQPHQLAPVLLVLLQ
jgi:hypothetical protein